MNIEKKAMVDFLIGCGDKETNKQIAQELREKPDGDVALFFKAAQERARNLLNLDWAALKKPEKDNATGEKRE